MNNVVLVGRLTQDVEMRFVPGSGTPVANFTIAVDRDFTDKDGNRGTDFIDIQVWNKQAETCEKYLNKGNMVSIQGSIRIEPYTDKEGIRRRSFRINASRVQFLTPKSTSNIGGNTQEEQFTPSFEPSPALDPNGFQAIDDDEIPF